MGRPRKFIRIVQSPDGRLVRIEKGGIEVYGLSINRSTGEYYSLHSGQRQYWGRDATRAVLQYLAGLQDRTGFQFGLVSAVVCGMTRVVERQDGSTVASNPASPAVPATVRARGTQRLRDCLTVWRELKRDESCHPLYIAKMTTVVSRFIALVGNKPVYLLNPDDFAAWRRFVSRGLQKNSADWANQHLSRLKTFLREVKRDKPLWGWPEGMLEWTGDFKTYRHTPAKENRASLPVDAFKRLIKAAEDLAGTDPEAYPKTTQNGRAKRLQAQRRQLEGLRWVAILRLACNCALDNVDCRRVTWQNVRDLDGSLPYLDFPRPKAKRLVGSAIDRKIPLLPSVVASLRTLREIGPCDGIIFRTAQGGPYSHGAFSKGFKRLATTAGLTGWTFKHLRNVAPTIGRRAKRSKDERDAILGHVGPGTSKLYEDDVDERFLVDLVNLVGREYFDGEGASG
ncbi:MAG: hypothetical protein AMXMBFR13_27980 [Phycisphaerae bacterium]